jgi:polar amino acid transport system permease protein
MNFDYAFILSTLPAFLKAVGVTLQVGFIAIGTSLLVALINATILVFRTPYLQRLVGLYVELARNTPLLIQLFFVYFALPALGIKVSGFAAAIITMTFLGGAYLTCCVPAWTPCLRRNSSPVVPSACPTGNCCAT